MLQLGVKGLMDSVYVIELSLPGWPMSAVHYIVRAAIYLTQETLPFESPHVYFVHMMAISCLLNF